MNSSLVILAGAFALGAAHAFEVDHLSAVSTFVARRPSPRQAACFGIQWAVGHGASLLLFGTLLFLLKLTLTDNVARWLERMVGFALLGVGLWTLLQLRAGWMHTHTHSHPPGEVLASQDSAEGHVHRHADGTTHSHGRGSLWMGMLHGAAGTAAFVGQSLIAVSQSYLWVVSFTLAFSLGVLLAMGAYAGILGGLMTWGERRAMLLVYGARLLTAAWACFVGVYWIFK